MADEDINIMKPEANAWYLNGAAGVCRWTKAVDCLSMWSRSRNGDYDLALYVASTTHAPALAGFTDRARD